MGNEDAQIDSPAVRALPEGLREAFVARIAHGAFDLPLLPEAATKLIALTQREDTELRELALVAQRDAAIAGHVMRIANSPLYSPTSPIVSLQQAITRLGVSLLREVALLVATKNNVFRASAHAEYIRELFRHALASAFLGRELARMRRWNVEEAFLSGLLHSVGKPVLVQVLADVEQRQHQTLPLENIRAVADAHHVLIAKRVLEQWHLPVRLAETIAFQANPLASTGAKQGAMLLAFAIDLAHLALLPNGSPQCAAAETALRDHPMIEPLNIYPDELDALLKARATVLETMQLLS